MKRGELIKTLVYDCPICGQVHEIEKRHCMRTTTIKDDSVEYDAVFFFCCNADEEQCEFVDGKMNNDNLLNARNAYRKKHNLLTSQEIVDIRKQYSLSQVELSRLLGWGDSTIARYESKLIQDEFYDKILKLIRNNPYETLQFLDGNKEKYSAERYAEIRSIIIANLDDSGKEHLSRQDLECEYAQYNNRSDLNGFTILDIDKVEAVITFLAERITDLYKVKLMKLLWYIDSLSFKEQGHTITGLVYKHAPMGALPLGHYKIVALNNVLSDEEEFEDYESTIIHFKPNPKIDMHYLTEKECILIERVIARFEAYSGKMLKEYMHKEIAYKSTNDGDIIPFSLAKQLRDF